MFNRLSYYIFSILILLNFESTNVSGVTCSSNQQTCYSSSSSWCCPIYKICGKYPSLCYDPTIRTSTFSPKPSSSFPSGLLAVIILLPMFCLILCVYTGIRSQQRSPSSVVTVNHRRVRNPHRQYPIQGPGRIIRARPVHSVSPAPPIPSLYEVPPPSYEAVTSDLPPKYESAPVTAMVNP